MNSRDYISIHIRCLGCGYILDGLPENRCPECGRGFNPGDVRTYDTGTEFPVKPLGWALLGAAGVACWIVGVVVAPGRWTFYHGIWLYGFAIIGWLLAARSLSTCLGHLRGRRWTCRGRAAAAIVLDTAALLPLGLMMLNGLIRLLQEFFKVPV